MFIAFESDQFPSRDNLEARVHIQYWAGIITQWQVACLAYVIMPWAQCLTPDTLRSNVCFCQPFAYLLWSFSIAFEAQLRGY